MGCVSIGVLTSFSVFQHTIKELFEMEDIPCKESETRAVSPVQSTEEGASVRQSNILEQVLALCTSLTYMAQ